MYLYVFVLNLLFISKIGYIQCDRVDDYVKLIQDETNKSNNYKAPINNERMYPDGMDEKTTDFGTFDFIVVGAGSAGAIVAKRLSDNNWKTLLIEAGTNENKFTDIPAAYGLVLNSEYTWPYYSIPQKYICLDRPNRTCNHVRGKAMGGSSTINQMVYARGNELDQSYWKDFGITGWTWDDVLPYYKKLENYDNINGEDGYHGFCGPIPINYVSPSNMLIRSFLRAYSKIGPITKDYNGKHYMGAGIIQSNKLNGRRASTAKCYLKKPKEYLSISINSYVYKIVINDTKYAIGVEFVKNKTRYTALCSKEVIISAGFINSPQILLLSGIGPRSELMKHSIPVTADLPVGLNYEDHFTVNLNFESKIKTNKSNLNLELEVWQYLSGSGRLTNTLESGLAFLSSENLNYPDLELVFYFGSPVLSQNSNSHYSQWPNYSYSIAVVLLHANSKGTVTLASNNPQDYPLIDTISTFDPMDWERMRKGINHVMKLLKTDEFKNLNVKLIKSVVPACTDFPYLSKEFWLCTIQHTGIAAFHGVGTCKMGKQGSSVVDSRLKVYGVGSLRVIDTSVVPRCNSGHMNAVAMMVGEKGADLVNQDYPRN